ncbi:preprotein translocase subunit SecE [Tsukamurella paurometabola]|uniref:preprotein translocase subunit SecE n=1 Tax=Tsukamurella paurometabola TaxID=2061 RepID=UPI000F7EB860|nr:preprotein translocase subunit SecE [Tsukamurella paurometabola]UEA85135.1 preprotein translocase subunit SecE [Tsukamurella paurometabola]
MCVSDEKDDATTGETAGDSAAEDAQQARPSGKRSSGRRSRTALAEAPEPGSAVESGTAKKSADAKPSRNPFAAIWLFIRQVVAELRKVIWPTRSQMINYTIIVLVFVVVLTAMISLLDLGFAKLMLWAFGK